MNRSLFAAAGFFAAVLCSPAVFAAGGNVTIGTGGSTGVYYATGQNLCKLLNAKDVPCRAEVSSGSVSNLRTLDVGEISMAMVQSDWQFHAFRGSSRWDGPQMEDLRAIFSIYAEPVQIIAKQDAGIKRWRDLGGKRINVGNLGSGHRQTFEQILSSVRWKLDKFSEVSSLSSDTHVDAFCDGKIDAFVYTVGIPNAAMKRAVADCGGAVIGPDSVAIRKLATAARPYYAKVTIPAGTYRDGQSAVKTFGVMATLVTKADADDKTVETLVKAVFEDFDAFKAMHPAYSGSTPEQMVKSGLGAPLHPAAKAYYQSKGWVK